MKASKKALRKLAQRVKNWEAMSGGGVGKSGHTKILPGGNAYHRPGSQNQRQHR